MASVPEEADSMFRLKRALVALFLALSLVAPRLADAGAKGSSGKSSEPKTVHVKEYKRKDGTTVTAHDRKAPESDTAASEPKTAKPKTAKAAEATTSASSTKAAVTRDERGRLQRSAAARHAFARQTGYPNGRPGYVIDHIVPLACGGADAPSNMQWQTVAEGKAKDRVERKGC